ncbi:hypothetical protein PVAND_007246 [Polypedilum vanderplanki]|nr:hypothetical protein PVAND_007246 [Polypedilum vanderplanki]
MTICTHLNTDNYTKTIEEEIQPQVAKINMSILLLNSIFPALFSLILGSWSDIFGRKKILMLAFTGYTCTIGLITLFSYISDNINPLTPWVYFFAEMPMTFMGGWTCLDVSVCCYAADLSSQQNRSIRLGTITFLNFFASAIAYFCSSYILNATNITFVFIIAISCAAAAFLWSIFIIDETIEPPIEVSKFDQIKEIFSTSRIHEIFTTLCKRRPQKCRKTLWSLMTVPILVVFTMHGNGTLNYLFVREKFAWSLREWTIFESTNTIISVSGLFIGLLLLKKTFKFSDITLGIVALTSLLVDALMKAFAQKSYLLYLSSGITPFRLLATPMFRSVMSVIVPHQEIGKIYSLTTCFEALSGLGAGPLYTVIYNNTFTVFPGAYHLLSACIFFFNLILCAFIFRWKSQVVSYQYE